MKHKRLSAAICTLTMLGTCIPLYSAPQTAVVQAAEYQTRDPFFNFSSGYNYYTSEHFQFIWGNSGDAAKVTDEFLRGNAENLEKCWDVYCNYLGMNECAESVETYLRDGNKYKLNIYISGTGLSGMADDWAYMSWDRQGYPYLFCCVGAMEYNPASWVMPHEFGHAITAHQLGWNNNKYSNTWWEALGNWFREQWLYQVSEEKGWTNDFSHGYGTDFFETYLKNMCFTSPFGRDYYSAWVFLQYLTENPDNMEGYGAEFVKTLLQNGQPDEYPFTMINRLSPADMKETLGNFAKRMATLDFAQKTAYRKRLDALLSQGAWNWQQIYTMLDPVDGAENTYAVPTERAPQATGVNVIPLTIEGDQISVTLSGRSELDGADWRGCIAVEDSAGNTTYSALFGNGETGTLVVPAGAASAYLTVIATPDESLYCPSGLHWHQDSDEFGETRQPFSSKHRYPYTVQINGAGIQSRPLTQRGHAHSNGGGFVADSARVDDSVYVGPNACVIGNATVTGNAVIDGYAMIAENATISGNAYVGDHAMVMGRAKVSGNAKVIESACIWDTFTVQDNAVVKGVAFCMANGSATGQAILDGDYYDDGSNSATKGACFGWYGTQTYLDARPYNDGQYLNYSFDTDSGAVIKDQYTSTYALPMGAVWEAERTSASGVMTLDGKDDFIDLDDSFAYFGDTFAYQFAALWRGGAANQKLFYFGDADNALSFTPMGESGCAELCLQANGAKTVVQADSALPVGEWAKISVEMENDTLKLVIGDRAYTAAASATPFDVMRSAGAASYSVLGKGVSGDYFNGSIDYARAYFKPVSDAPEQYSGKEDITVTEPIETTTTTTETTTTTTQTDPAGSLRGDVNCDKQVTISDAILLSRMLAEDPEAYISDQGMVNAECTDDNVVNNDDTVAILKYLAGFPTF